MPGIMDLLNGSSNVGYNMDNMNPGELQDQYNSYNATANNPLSLLNGVDTKYTKLGPAGAAAMILNSILAGGNRNMIAGQQAKLSQGLGNAQSGQLAPTLDYLQNGARHAPAQTSTVGPQIPSQPPGAVPTVGNLQGQPSIPSEVQKFVQATGQQPDETDIMAIKNLGADEAIKQVIETRGTGSALQALQAPQAPTPQAPTPQAPTPQAGGGGPIVAPPMGVDRAAIEQVLHSPGYTPEQKQALVSQYMSAAQPNNITGPTGNITQLGRLGETGQITVPQVTTPDQPKVGFTVGANGNVDYGNTNGQSLKESAAPGGKLNELQQVAGGLAGTKEATYQNTVNQGNAPSVVANEFKSKAQSDIQSGYAAGDLLPTLSAAKSMNDIVGTLRGQSAEDATKMATTLSTITGQPISPQMSDSQVMNALGQSLNGQIVNSMAGKLGGAAFNKGGQFDLTNNSPVANTIQMDFFKQQLNAQKQLGKLATDAAMNPEKQASYADDRAKILSNVKVHVPDANGKMVDITTYNKNKTLQANEGKVLTDGSGNTIKVLNGQPVKGKMVDGKFVADGQ